MAEFYDNGLNRRGRKRSKTSVKRRRDRNSGRSIWLMLTDAIMAIITVVLACAIVLVIVMQYIDPEKMWILPTLTLCAPIIYILEVAAMLYWIIRWKWRLAVFAILFVAAGSVYLPLYYKIDLTRRYDTEYVERNFTKVVSYNVANGNKPELVKYIDEMRPDIACLQEFLTEKVSKWDALDKGYRSTVSGDETFSCEIFTRYPIIRQGLIDSIPRYNSVWADLKIADDTVRVINLHLQSTSIRQEDTQFIQHHEYIFDNDREDKLKSIILRLADNTRKRAVQAGKVREFIEKSPYDMIICGDFNDVPLSYSYHLIANGLKDAFCEAGNGYSYTFNGFFRSLQIDHILVSPDIEVISYEADNSAEYSDHYPVITRLKIDKPKKP